MPIAPKTFDSTLNKGITNTLNYVTELANKIEYSLHIGDKTQAIKNSRLLLEVAAGLEKEITE